MILYCSFIVVVLNFSEKMTFLAGVACLDHWEDEGILKLCDRMEKIQHTYNDVIVVEGEPANYFYFVKQGECRMVKRYSVLEQRTPQHNRKQPCFVEMATICSTTSVSTKLS